jgi:hypothetical protein
MPCRTTAPGNTSKGYNPDHPRTRGRFRLLEDRSVRTTFLPHVHPSSGRARYAGINETVEPRGYGIQLTDGVGTEDWRFGTLPNSEHVVHQMDMVGKARHVQMVSDRRGGQLGNVVDHKHHSRYCRRVRVWRELDAIGYEQVFGAKQPSKRFLA